jgi:hypothetical protein
MKHLILAIVAIVAALWGFPRFIPQLYQHAFSLGELDIKWAHVLAAALVLLVFRGGK